MQDIMIRLDNISHKFGSNTVLDEINLAIGKGEVVGIVGTNGCGKTTLLKIILGFIYPTSGTVIVDGKKIEPGILGALPTRVGALIESPSFLPYLNGFENLEILALIRNEIDKKKIKDIMEYVGLDSNSTKKVSQYSLGMKQRLGIAQAIMEDQNILLFDEPTNALDIKGVDMFIDLVQKAVANRKTVILVSHRQDEIALLCNRVFLLENGSISLIKEQ
ncbi:MAG TPA: ABC transporter ATP-binding protein [Clostridiales bacterium]|nr:ABC transporter ATP-binding protein [Clostridiales bacterium]